MPLPSYSDLNDSSVSSRGGSGRLRNNPFRSAFSSRRQSSAAPLTLKSSLAASVPESVPESACGGDGTQLASSNITRVVLFFYCCAWLRLVLVRCVCICTCVFVSEATHPNMTHSPKEAV